MYTTQVMLRRRIAMAALAVVVSSAVAMAVPVSAGFQLSLAPQVQIYSGPSGSPAFTWNTAGTVYGTFQDDLGLVKYKMVATDPNSFAWTGNARSQEQSSGGLAKATFLGGGTISITGKLKRTNNTVVFDSALSGGAPVLVGTVDAFKVRETGPSDNMLESYDTLIKFTATGGYLFDTAALTQTRGVYDFSFTASTVGQMLGGALADFSTDDLVSLDPVQLSFDSVPEPSMVVVLGLGIGLVLKRRSQVA